MYFSVDVHRKGPDTYIASCSELDVHSYGATAEMAVERLKRIVSFYLESAEEMGMSLEELGLKNASEKNPVPRVAPTNIAAALH